MCAAPQKRRQQEELERARASDSGGESSNDSETPLTKAGGSPTSEARSIAVKTPKKLKGASTGAKRQTSLYPKLISAQQSDPKPSTSSETMPEITDDSMHCDMHEFKLVSHKRKSIPLVIRSTDGGDLRITNPIKQHEQLLKTTGENYIQQETLLGNGQPHY